MVNDLFVVFSWFVCIINDVNVFVFVEVVDGIGVGKDVVFGIIFGIGVGGGLVNKGELIIGYGGMVGEWGYGLVIDLMVGGMIIGILYYDCGCG